MSRDLNKVTLMGRLGGAPEMRFTQGGTAVAQFSLATNNRYTNAAGDKVDDVQWHRVIIWGKAAQVATQYLQKGHRLYLEGRLQYRKWVDKEGQDRYSTEVVADEFIFLEHSPAGRVQADQVAEGLPF
jgi:single-strand DNA-binding protein